MLAAVQTAIRSGGDVEQHVVVGDIAAEQGTVLLAEQCDAAVPGRCGTVSGRVTG
jgi:hypothetical protein